MARIGGLESSTEEERFRGSIASLTHFSSPSGSGRLDYFNYRPELNPSERAKAPYLDLEQCESKAVEFWRLLQYPSEPAITKRRPTDDQVEFIWRYPSVLGHQLDSSFRLVINRYGGFLQAASAGLVYDTSDLKRPRVSGEEAAGIALSEYQRAGMFDITHLSEPILMAGRPMVSDEYRDRVSLDRLNQFQGSKPVSFWRVGFSAHDGARFAGTSHIVEVDAQTGEIVGEVRMSALGSGGGEPPALSWPKIGDVAVVGDKSKMVGRVEALVTKDLPGGKPVSVQSGKLIYACRYDAKKNILWRRLAGGKYEPGRPEAKLAKTLKSRAR